MERKTEYPIFPLILNRHSPRSMTKEMLRDEEFMPLFEAARWAPSSYNNQPWRYLFVKRGSEKWHLLFDLLVEFNQRWCKNASVLVLIYSKLKFEKTGKDCPTHSFDTGASWQNLSLEGASRNLVVHGMQGFDYEKAKKLIPEEHQVEAMCAIGKPDKKEKLPPDIQKMEVLSQRKKLSEIVREL